MWLRLPSSIYLGKFSSIRGIYEISLDSNSFTGTFFQPDIKDEAFMYNIIHADNTVTLTTLKGTEKPMLDTIRPFCCVLHCNLE